MQTLSSLKYSPIQRIPDNVSFSSRSFNCLGQFACWFGMIISMYISIPGQATDTMEVLTLCLEAVEAWMR